MLNKVIRTRINSTNHEVTRLAGLAFQSSPVATALGFALGEGEPVFAALAALASCETFPALAHT